MTRIPPKGKQLYVAGFLFDSRMERVALIRKNKPRWQAGKLNGIGGKIESTDPSAACAMAREFEEETGVGTTFDRWRHFLSMSGPDFQVEFFAALAILSDLEDVESTTDEIVEVMDVTAINPFRSDLVENLSWLIPLAIDFLRDGRPGFVSTTYPSNDE